MLDPDLLRAFVAVAETGSVTAAAGRVHRTQSAVSMQIRRLEELLGRRLLDRSGRGVALSAEGELLLPHARALLRAEREVLALFAEGAPAGRVRIGAPDDYASTFLPASLARFAESHPRVEVEMVVASSAELVPALARADGPDLALVTQGSGETGGVVARREPLVWVAAAGRAVETLPVLPLALFQQGCVFRRAALAALAEAGRPCRIAYTSVSLAGVFAAVAAGLAVGVVLRSSVRPGLRILSEAQGLPALPSVGIVLARAERPLGPAAEALASHVLAALAAAPSLAAA
jgi:DNA-binding transcriptional LysR family regulator